jgi:DNA-binding SARP family transcriptional activator/tetratricopeptide (TPR) repeat protein
VRFALLGPLSAADDEGPVRITGRLRRTLLAALLLEAGRPVSADRLAELLWGPEASGTAYAPLHAQPARLRQALGREDRVRAAAPGYLIQVEPGELDLHVFAEECAAGRRKLADGAWAEAARHFGDALGLWRGRPLADIPALADDLRIRELEETRLEALQGRIEAELNLARHHELLAELRALTERHPRREAFRGQLMLALHRAGQPDEAAAAYDEYEQSLPDELGLEPGVELRELHEAVVRRDPALALPPNPNAPRQLPADTRTFTGRDREPAELVAAAGQISGTLVISALDGMAGIGKTALAVHAAHRVVDRFRDGQLFIDLRGHAAGSAPVRPEDALAYLLRSLGVPPQAIPPGTEERTALYRSRLADSRTLIVLDNAADPEQVRPLLPAGPGCLVLVTSRSRLTGLDRAHALTLDILGEREAVALLGKVAGTEHAPADSAAVRELAALCGYVPLALRIVAARLRHQRDLSVDVLVAQMRNESGRLGQLNDGDRDLTAVFDSAFADLPAAEQGLLRMLGLLPGPDVDAYAAASLVGADRADLAEAERLLESLLDRNLLIQQTAGRYRMHDLIRAYARSLTDTGDLEARTARSRLLDYYEAAAWTAARQLARTRRPGPDPSPMTGAAPELPELADLESALAWMRAERPNLIAAISAISAVDSVDAVDTTDAAPGEPSRRVGLTAALSPLLELDGPWPLATSLHQAAAEAARAAGDRLAEANAIWDQCAIQRMTHTASTRETETLFDEVAEIYRELGDEQGEANVLNEKALMALAMDAPGSSREPARAALAIFRRIGDRKGETRALHFLTSAAQLTGQADEAMRLCREALRIDREIGNRQGESLALLLLGRMEFGAGDLASATEHHERASTIFREIGHRQNEGVALLELGEVYTTVGAHAKATEVLNAALRLFRELDFRGGLTLGRYYLGRDLLKAGDAATSVECFRDSLSGFQAMGHRRGEAVALHDLGLALYRTGDASGVALIEEALEICRSEGVEDVQGEAEAVVYLGEVAFDGGETRTALELYVQALALARKAQSLLDEAHAFDEIALPGASGRTRGGAREPRPGRRRVPPDGRLRAGRGRGATRRLGGPRPVPTVTRR